MRRRDVVVLLSGIVASPPRWALAQRRPMPVIGFLHPASSATTTDMLTAFREGLKETGYIEGQNVAIEYRWAEGRYQLLPELAADLVRSKVNVIVATGGTSSVLAAKKATATIPILFSTGFDPEKTGLVPSLHHPTGNATGAMLYTSALQGKRLQLLHELVSFSAGDGVAALINPNAGGSEIEATDLSAAARSAGLQLRVFKASVDNDLDTAFSEAKKAAKAIIVSADSFFGSRRSLIVRLAAQYKVPAIYSLREYVRAGGLMSYGPRILTAYQIVGNYAGRILKGAKPEDLPVQGPTHFDFTVNRTAMTQLGLPLPRILMAQADEIFE
jgi:ABC-type uncharacterized transport system substrate-binding protein